MEPIAIFCFWAATLLWASMFITAPVLVRFKSYLGANPEFQSVDPHALPPDVAAFFSRTLWEMKNIEFEVAGYFRLLSYANNVETYTVLLRNAAAGDMSGITAMHSTTGMRLHYVEFYTELGDRRCFGTCNSPEPAINKRPEKVNLFYFPEAAHPVSLYDLHRRLLWRHAPGQSGVLPSEGMESAYYLYHIDRFNRHQVEIGYWFVDEAQDVFRPTWKGATLSAWKTLQPVRSIRRARLRSEAKRVMAELGRAA